jgi:hypothetical protein
MESDTLFYTCWLLLNDKQFIHDHCHHLTPDIFPKGPLQGLTAIAIDQEQRFRRTTTVNVLGVALSNGFRAEQYGTSAEEMLRIYQQLDAFAVDEEARPRAVQDCLSWITQRMLGMTLDAGLTSLERGDAKGAKEALDDARKLGRTEEPPLRLSEHYADAMKPLEDNAVPCGLPFVDRCWRGGVRPGELAVLLASTNLGKTQALCFFAGVAYRANLQVLYYTFELNPKEILRRITSGLLGRPSGSIDIEETGQLLAQIRLNRGITEADIEIRTGSLKVSDVVLDLEEMEQDGRKPDVVLLDSADDLGSRQAYQSLYMQHGEIYSDLRQVALSQRVAIWTSTQATREAIDKAKISLKHIGDSYWKARRAHFVLGLSQSESDRDDPFGAAMTMRVLKDSQHGSPGKWRLVRPKFGPGFEGRGYPGFEEVEGQGG